MNSIQNIVDKIIKEAEDYSKEKTALANAEKDEMLSKAKSEADSIVKLAEEEAKRGEKAQRERAEASFASIVGNAILKTKVEILDSVFETAAKSLMGDG